MEHSEGGGVGGVSLEGRRTRRHRLIVKERHAVAATGRHRRRVLRIVGGEGAAGVGDVGRELGSVEGCGRVDAAASS